MPAYQNMKPLRLLVLVAIGGVLIGTLLSFVERWQDRVADSGSPNVEPLQGEVDQQTRAFSLAKTEGDHTLYTIKADQVTTLKETQKSLLRGVVVEIFGKTGTRRDRITTAECEYDPIAQTLWVPGEVEMSFHVPPSGAKPSISDAQHSPDQRVVIHTSQLGFDQSTGNASTDADVRFTFPQGDGRSRGARYDSQQQMLHLVSAVEFTLQGEPGRGEAPTKIRAGELRYLRNEGRILMDQTVEMIKDTRRVRARTGTVWLNDANQVRRTELVGDVQADELSGAAPASVRAGRANLEFAEEASIRSVELLEAVSWKMGGAGKAGATTPLREGTSQRMLLSFEPVAADGKAADKSSAKRPAELDRADATGNVQITLRGRAEETRSRTASDRQATAGQTQVLSGQEAEMHFAQAGKVMSDAKLRGAPEIVMYETSGAAPRTITANAFDFDFSDQGQLTQVHATENVRVTSPVPAAADAKADTRITTSNNMQAVFDPANGKLTSLRQSGNFAYQDSTRRAQSGSALYEANEELLTLERAPAGESGGSKTQPQPAVIQPEGRIAANLIKLYTRSGNLDASGAVVTTSTPSASGGASANSSKEPVHGVADKLRYDATSKSAYYSGRTRLWQGTGFLLEAKSATLDRQKNLLTAQGNVLTVFKQAPNGANAKTIAKADVKTTVGAEAGLGNLAGTYVIRSEKVSYAQAAGKILYEGNVRANQDGGTLTSSTLEIFLKGAAATPQPGFEAAASQIDKMIARENVKLNDNGRVGSGDTAEYFAESRKVNLYGKPATLSDPARGSTKGVQLTYQIGDNKASVVGDGGEQTESRWVPTK
jgi:lipopolysaccharide export system protein LptA